MIDFSLLKVTETTIKTLNLTQNEKKILLKYFREKYQSLHFRRLTEALMMIMKIRESKKETVKLVKKLLKSHSKKEFTLPVRMNRNG